MRPNTIASTAVLDHLHHWQRLAGLPLTWPTFTSQAYRDQWQAIKLAELQASTRS